jgi:leader peptidase (prepilin peptidase)/N-methyltransferase
MHYLSLLPSLITALALSIIDLRTRTVPRAVVGCGFVGQAIVFALIGGPGELAHLATAIGFALASGALQVALCVLKPGAMGLGDATALTLLSLGIAWQHGVAGICALWLATGVVGLCALGVTHIARSGARADQQLGSRPDSRSGARAGSRSASRGTSGSIAFVPVLSVAALATYLVLEML